MSSKTPDFNAIEEGFAMRCVQLRFYGTCTNSSFIIVRWFVRGSVVFMWCCDW